MNNIILKCLNLNVINLISVFLYMLFHILLESFDNLLFAITFKADFWKPKNINKTFTFYRKFQ